MNNWRVWGLSLFLIGSLQAGSLSTDTTQKRATTELGAPVASSLTANGVKKLLSGKKFYAVDYYGHCLERVSWEAELALGTVTINNAVTQLQYRFPDGSGNVKIRAIKNGLRLSEDGETSFAYLSLHNKKYIQFEDEGFTRFYYKKADARAYLNRLKRELKGFSVSSLKGKTYYLVFLDTFEKYKVRFTKKQMILSDGSKTEKIDYKIGKHGEIELNDGDNTRIFVRKRFPAYIEVATLHDPSPYVDRSTWFEKTYGTKVADLGGSAEELAELFIRDGLRGLPVTRDHRIVGDQVTGYWEVDHNRFEFSFPRRNRLVFQAFEIQNDRLLFSEDSKPYSAARLYVKQPAANTFLRKARNGDAAIDLSKTVKGKTFYFSEGEHEEKSIESLTLRNDGKIFAKEWDAERGRIMTEYEGDYTLDEATHAIITFEDGEEEVHPVVEHNAKWILVREPDGEPTYLYRSRLHALDGITQTDDCR